MRSWKRRTRARYKREIYISENSDSRNYWPNIRPKFRKRLKEYRKTRAWMHYAKLKFQESMYVVDCRYHPCLVNRLTPELYNDGSTYNYDIDCTSLINGAICSCSYRNCGVEHISEAEAHERTDVIKTLGMLPYMVRFYFEENPTQERVVKYISGDKRMQREWKFNSNSNTADITEEGRKWLMDTHGIDYDAVPEMSDEEYLRA